MKQKPSPAPGVPSTTNPPAAGPGLPATATDTPIPPCWDEGEPRHPAGELPCPTAIGAAPAVAPARLPPPSTLPMDAAFPPKWHPSCEGEEVPGEEGFPSVHRAGRAGFQLALPPGAAAVQAAAVPACAHLPSTSRFMVCPPHSGAEVVEGTRRSASDAAAPSSDGRVRERSPRRKSWGAADKI